MAQYALLADRRYPLTSAMANALYHPVHERPPTFSWHTPATRDRASHHLTDTIPTESTLSTFLNPFAPAWSLDPVAQSSCRTYNLSAADGFSLPSEYPESSQRTILPPSPTPEIIPSYPYKSASLKSPPSSPEYDSQLWEDDVYAVERSQSSRPPSIPPPTKVKSEEPDGCFIMELPASSSVSQALAPPTEVPLRATQASDEMRGMMGVFRLNPFAMHNGAGRGVVPSSWNGGEARPLDEEPLIFEFQLDPDYSPASSQDALRPFSPEFELPEVQDEGEKNEWSDYRSESAFAQTSSWDLEYTTCEDQYLTPETAPTQFCSRNHSRLHNSISHPYLRKNPYHEPENYSSLHNLNSSVYMNRMRPPSSWSRGGYEPISRSSTYASDSSGCDIGPESLQSQCLDAQLPSFPSTLSMPQISSTHRRWSLPDSNLSVPFLI